MDQLSQECWKTVSKRRQSSKAAKAARSARSRPALTQVVGLLQLSAGACSGLLDADELSAAGDTEVMLGNRRSMMAEIRYIDKLQRDGLVQLLESVWSHSFR